MAQTPEMDEEPPQVRLLRRLSMALIVVLILGFLTIVGTIVIRLGFGGAPGQGVAVETLVLPAGDIVATGQGPGTVHVVLRDAEGVERLLVFDAGTGERITATVLQRP